MAAELEADRSDPSGAQMARVLNQTREVALPDRFPCKAAGLSEQAPSPVLAAALAFKMAA